MRLEIDTTVSAPPLTEKTETAGGVDSSEVKSILNQGIKAAQAGNRAQARTSLMRATELDSRNESAWLWLASISEYPEELLGFLNHVLDINPENQRALEWKAATHGLLSKTFVQRGIDASHESNKDFATECFRTALEYDERNADAWVWIASLSDSSTVKIAMLEKALTINPDNESATAALELARAWILKDRLSEAKSAAVAGDRLTANNVLDALLAVNPHSVEAWMMKSHLTDSFDEKIQCFERILEIDPNNVAAMAGRDSLVSIFGTVEPPAVELTGSLEPETESVEATEVEVVSNWEQETEPVESAEVEVVSNWEPETSSVEAAEVEAVSRWEAETSPVESAEVEVVSNWEPAAESVESAEVDVVSNWEPATESVESAEVEVVSNFEPETESAETAEVEIVSNFEPETSSVEYVDETIDKSPTQDLEMPVYEFVSPDAGIEYTPEEIECSPEEYDDHEQLETVAEPFASFAEETPEPVEATVGAEQSYDYDGVSEFVEEGPVAEAENVPDRALADTQLEATIVSYDTEQYVDEPGLSVDEPAESVSNDEWTGIASDDAIQMPSDALPETVKEPEAATFVEEVREVIAVKAESFDCPFCRQENDTQTIACEDCGSVLTLSDLELLLANQNSDTALLRHAVDGMERRRASGEFTTAELITLGVGHLNLRNLQTGYACLAEASKLNPNDVVLSGQVNALLIRLDEIKKQEEAHLKMPKGKSILVVDDSPTVRKLIAGKLEKCGHEVVCATDGVEAMERLENFVPDLVLLDISMPRMDGYQVCKQIRSNNATKDVTVVMISGKDGFFDKVRGRMAGTTGYITKPFGPETLMKAVEMYLSGEVPDLDEV